MPDLGLESRLGLLLLAGKLATDHAALTAG
jgi:hypothetical protein